MLAEQHNFRHNGSLFLTIFFCLLTFGTVTTHSAFAENDTHISPAKAAVIVSQKIRPYLAALEGASETLSTTGTSTEIIFLSDFPDNARTSLQKKLLSQHFNLFIAIGPEAANFIDSFPATAGMPAMVRTMLLHPKHTPPYSSCSVYLNIPVSIQIENIAQILPVVERIGLLYDPKLNADFFTSASRHADQLGKKIIPMAISAKRAIPSVLKSHWQKIDALWFIPDRTVISESIITHVTKQAILHGIPVIGFNSFFRDSGAVLSFIFNYHDLGKQTAALGLKLIDGDTCKQQVPLFRIELNQKVITKLSIAVSAPHASSEENK